ncbi:NmrA family protein [Nitzschia inconspicua]|uniref:NmrA family protein n=1 Tax=Nitzschia inconspicua TaxID=303405 RepID=A0A9K3Q907_9STRA|nr:NmrA family protein [Nitzschia inconspicua]
MSSLVMFGATGGLGMEVAKGLVTAEGFEPKRSVVRDASSDKAKKLQAMGWTLVEVKDLTDPAALEAVVQGAKVVVSTLSGNDMIPIETSIIHASKKAGVTLFVPSQFGVDYTRWGSAFPFLAGKKAVLDAAEKEGLPTLSVFAGFFSDLIFELFCDFENSKVTWIGDGNDKVTWTRRSDIGYVLAKALADPELSNGGTLGIQGDFQSFNDATKILGDALGKEFTIEYMDPNEAKKQEDELLKNGLKGDLGAFFGSFKLHLMGEPARGNNGCDLSMSFNNYGIELQTLEDVCKSGVYGS